MPISPGVMFGTSSVDPSVCLFHIDGTEEGDPAIHATGGLILCARRA
ncbi:MAG: hypothetical protein JW829_18095 [Pirellulales bacterium]|nr:hypothetical protein [Pirellulales bacterium]